ncbi:MAG: PBP1A family penicillin-binding protein [Candidatus Kerfeldbacteria bacterium]|nr:PBP1A family penicillin-binding protein [Candidatus Kerfeldbacteria bacterium]
MPIPHLRTPKRPRPDAEDAETKPEPVESATGKTSRPADRPVVRTIAALASIVIMATRRVIKKIRDRLKKPSRRRLVRFWLPIAGICLLVLILGGLITFAWFSRDLPDPDRISERNVAQSTRIYARDGTTLLYEIHGDEKRTVVNLSDISPHVINGTIAIEDKDFRKHKGISIAGIIRAVWRDVTTGSTQGGSTITQQFVKNAILTSEKSITRKVREWVLSYQIERRFTKDQILKLYFNEIPYGSNAYGIEAAAQSYFGKNAKDLTLAESAILAALPQAPTFYSPYGNHTADLLRRSHYVLDLMAEQGFVSPAEAAAAKAEDVLASVKPKRESITAPHFVFYVRELLTEKYGERAVERDGLKVVTTLDPEKQKFAEEAVAEQEGTNATRYDAHNAAVVATDPKTGQVLAMVGSRDYFNRDIDGNVNVALTLQQPGSSIKPIVYATAFSRGYTPDTMLFDVLTRFKVAGAPDYVPRNYNGKENGPVTMRKALAGSLNIPAVKTLYLAGLDHVIDQAQKLGYTTWNDRSRLGLSLVLGGADVTLLEHTAAFAALANDGMRERTTPILRIEDKNGKVLEEFKSQSERAIDEEAARLVTDVMSDNEARSFVFGGRNRLTLPDRPVAAKTGTTQEYRDAWTMGFTPSLAAGVWVGNNQNRAMKSGADGSIVAAPIWNSFMRKATAGTKVESFKKPKAIKTDKPVLQGKLEGEAPIKVDSVTGKEIPESCLDDWPKEFVKEKTVKAVHTILFYVDPEDPRGAAPKNPEKNPQFNAWESPIQAWAKENGYVEKRPEKESCSLRTSAPTITIMSPAANDTVGATVNVNVTATSKRPISTIEYRVDSAVLATLDGTGTSTTLDLSAITNGFHTLTVKMLDDVKNSASASVTINVLRDVSASTIYFVAPAPGASVKSSDPLTISAFAYDSTGVDEVRFSAIGPAGNSIDIGTASVDSRSLATLSWDVPVVPGKYKLSVNATARGGQTLASDFLTITVGP